MDIMAETDSATPNPQTSILPESERSPETAILLSIGLAFLGATISFLLARIHAGGQTLICPAGGGCEAVLTSKYSTFLGIPLPWVGVASYLALLGLLLLALGTAIVRLRIASLGLTFWFSGRGRELFGCPDVSAISRAARLLSALHRVGSSYGCTRFHDRSRRQICHLCGIHRPTCQRLDDRIYRAAFGRVRGLVGAGRERRSSGYRRRSQVHTHANGEGNWDSSRTTATLGLSARIRLDPEES